MLRLTALLALVLVLFSRVDSFSAPSRERTTEARWTTELGSFEIRDETESTEQRNLRFAGVGRCVLLFLLGLPSYLTRY
jgi:hypothetical protein